MMKPSGVVLFIIAVLLLLMTIAMYFPEEGLHITDKVSLKFFRLEDVFSPDREVYADIDDILRMQALLDDTVSASADIIYPAANMDSLLSGITRLEYPSGDTTALYGVFSSLGRPADVNGPVRIMHYGDSQIEDDRITSYLRYRLQTRFGGSGVGLVPAAPLYPYSFSLTQENSDNWDRYVICGSTDTTSPSNRYGAMSSFGCFTSLQSSADTSEAWVRFSPSRYSYANTKSFNICRIFYGHNEKPFIVKLYRGDSLFDADLIPASEGLRVKEWDFESPVEDITLRFAGPSSPEIYGIALDGASGVAVDNVALRGCSGPFLTSSDRQLLSEMYGRLSVKMFILQFGGNMVPAEIQNFRGYEDWFYSQIKRIQDICPDAAVLVIGPADMSVRDRDRYVTSPNVEKVREALRNAASRTNAAFWDMYKAMGGRNSMPAWVNASPSLAASDYVHFNPRGARTIAQMFYNAFILEYQNFEKSN